jgi:hypothetical protein
VALLAAWAAPVSAGWAIGVGIGGPVYYRPYHYYPYYHYYRPYAVVVDPAPVVVPPVYPPPVGVQPTYAAPEPVPLPVPRAVAPDDRQADIDRRIQHLSNPDAGVRADVAIELGRMKAEKAVDALTTTLSGDTSPAVREASARALGLIGSARALPALQRAAQADADREVRNSARFAADVIQTNR